MKIKWIWILLLWLLPMIGGCAFTYDTKGFDVTLENKDKTKTLFEVNLSATKLEVAGDPASAFETVFDELIAITTKLGLLPGG